MFILLVSCSSEKKSENIDYLGKTRAEIIKERGNPVEDEKQLGKFDEVIAYGKDFLNYEVFFLKNDICFQHNQTYPVFWNRAHDKRHQIPQNKSPVVYSLLPCRKSKKNISYFQMFRKKFITFPFFMFW